MDEPHPALEDAKALIGHTIADRYRVDAVLGAGGMGAVFRCHHLSLKRDVAVKMLHPELTSDPQVAPRFDREAQSASRLEHPNIMQVFDYGSWTVPGRQDAIKYMVMQLLDGFELTELLGQPLAPRRAVDLMLQVVRGLEHAHERGVVHRDLKPENVYVTKDHTGAELLKLVDFGIAKIASGDGSDEKLTRMGLVFGTPHYMSPEQAMGSDVDHRADLYSAGVLFYELLAGHVPFQSDDAVAIIRMQVSTAMPPLPPSVPAPLVAIVARMLEKERESRFQNAGEVRTALEAVLLSIPESAASAPATSPTRVDETASTMPVAVPAPAGAAGLAHRLGVPPVALYAVGGATVLMSVLIIAVAARSSSDGAEGEPQAMVAPADAVGQTLGRMLTPGASDEAISKLDALIAANSDAEALAMLDGLLAEFGSDARLHFRRATVLARDPAKSSVALAAYAKAMELDPRLLDDSEFYPAMLETLRKPEVTVDAMELAIGPMGEHGHPFLLELVNRERQALPFVDRHRVLLKLDGDDQMSKLVDRKLNLVHDIWQAKTTPQPCAQFDAALTTMEQAPDASFLGTVHKVKAPKGKGADAEKCKGLAERLMKLRLSLSVKFPEADKERWVPADYASKKKKKRRRGGLSGLFGG